MTHDLSVSSPRKRVPLGGESTPYRSVAPSRSNRRTNARADEDDSRSVAGFLRVRIVAGFLRVLKRPRIVVVRFVVVSVVVRFLGGGDAPVTTAEAPRR